MVHDEAKTVILCCPTLQKELEQALQAVQSRARVIILPDGLHSDPRYLHNYVQQQLDGLQDAERVVVCPSGCGGGTIGLKATHCELVLPRTRDCLDILLSGESIADIKRPKHGVFMTESWAEYSRRSSIDVDKVLAAKGKEEGENFLRKLYKGFEHFYIIDTGVYDVEAVRAYMEKLRVIVNGTIDVVPGAYGVLKKIATGNFDADFLIVPQGESVPASYFTVNKDL